MNAFCNKMPLQNVCECLWMSFPSVEEGFLSSSMGLDRKSNFGVKSCLEDLPLPLAALSSMVSSHVQPSKPPFSCGCRLFCLNHQFPSYYMSPVFSYFPLFPDLLATLHCWFYLVYRPFYLMAPAVHANPGLRTLASFPESLSQMAMVASLHAVPLLLQD